jgi:hypothetical protein
MHATKQVGVGFVEPGLSCPSLDPSQANTPKMYSTASLSPSSVFPILYPASSAQKKRRSSAISHHPSSHLPSSVPDLLCRAPLFSAPPLRAHALLGHSQAGSSLRHPRTVAHLRQVSWPRQGLTHAVRDDTFLSIVGLRGKCWPEYCNAGNALSPWEIRDLMASLHWSIQSSRWEAPDGTSKSCF